MLEAKRICLLALSSLVGLAAVSAHAAIIGPDDRQMRVPGRLSTEIEAAQGRIYCHVSGPPPGPSIPTKEEMAGRYRVSNATLVFRNDVALVNRHRFVDAYGNQTGSDPRNCFFEHVQSGKLYRVAGGEYPAYVPDSKAITRSHNDFALVRLTEPPEGAAFVTEQDIVVGPDPAHPVSLQVISNYAANGTGDRRAPTITTCESKTSYRLEDGRTANAFGSNCDTGSGSSGATAWVAENGSLRLFGIVSGEAKNIPEGGDYSSRDLNTVLTTFDSSLFESYERLMGTGPQVVAGPAGPAVPAP